MLAAEKEPREVKSYTAQQQDVVPCMHRDLGEVISMQLCWPSCSLDMQALLRSRANTICMYVDGALECVAAVKAGKD